MVGLDPIALTGRFFSVLAAPRRALLRSGGGISLEPRSGDIVEPGARAPGLRLAPWQPSPGGATPGAGMEHRGGWSARRCRPRWGPGKWMIRVVLGLMPQALRSRPASGAQKRLTSNVGRTHVERDACEAKFWLDPMRLERSTGFSRKEINRIRERIELHREQLLGSWDEFFNG